MLVRATPERITDGFALVRRLQEAGFGAEIDLGASPDAYDWTVQVSADKCVITARDGKSQTLDSSDAVVGALDQTRQGK